MKQMVTENRKCQAWYAEIEGIEILEDTLKTRKKILYEKIDASLDRQNEIRRLSEPKKIQEFDDPVLAEFFANPDQSMAELAGKFNISSHKAGRLVNEVLRKCPGDSQ